MRLRATACSSFLSTLRDGVLARLALASSSSDTLPSAGFRSTSLSKLSSTSTVSALPPAPAADDPQFPIVAGAAARGTRGCRCRARARTGGGDCYGGAQTEVTCQHLGFACRSWGQILGGRPCLFGACSLASLGTGPGLEGTGWFVLY